MYEYQPVEVNKEKVRGVGWNAAECIDSQGRSLLARDDLNHKKEETVRSTRLLPRHFKIIELLLDGHSFSAISRAMGMQSSMIELIAKTPAFQDEFARRRKEIERKSDSVRVEMVALARETIENESLRAAEKLGELVESPNENVARLSAAKLLDLAFGVDTTAQGGKKGRPTIVTVEQLQVLNIALAECKGRGASVRRESGELVEQGESGSTRVVLGEVENV